MVQVLIPLVVIAACVLIRVKASVAVSVDIARLPNEVFGYVANPLNVPRFNHRVLEVRGFVPPLRVGSQWELVLGTQGVPAGPILRYRCIELALSWTQTAAWWRRRAHVGW